MADIIGGVVTSHVPAIGRAIAKNLQADPYWAPFFEGYAPLHRWIEKSKPDVVVVIYNDHGLNFFLDKMPTFAVGAAPSYTNSDEGWGIPAVPAFTGQQALSWHIINALIDEEFDLTTCQEMLVDHAFTLPMALCWPDQATAEPPQGGLLPSGGGREQRPGGADRWPVKVVPVCINTAQFPMPSAARCYKLGEAIGRAIRSWNSDERVMVMGTGGLSHQLDGERAGFINREFDQQFMQSMIDDPKWATQYSIPQLVEKTGTQGVELVMWLAARGALGEQVKEVTRNYHIPISNTAAGLMVLETQG
ncbi:Protocatechuate 4,5-dioxygenase [Leptothrix cholodnii SP-6]|uniref:Protocatechuate 4,5-dioxygenase n=1 Tax=Leptothrix cholodnii (strain ATCC 51168 / LMG 8142 / SP-6) TaxID=395495 RepID=B1Y5Q7_LEPCP|nr:class III extradiol dioxygenase family protein [Leptothrix cholodnii]ACB35953.1 Protocatechuate 4,5-dioxygenase [Leptothrix cholodnii SP-6]